MVQTGLEAGLGSRKTSGAAGPSSYRQRISTPDGVFGEDGGFAAKAGEALGKLADYADEQENIKATKAMQDFTREVNSRQYDGEEAWLGKKGANALGLHDKATKELDEIQKRYVADLSPVAAQYFTKSSSKLVESTSMSLERYEFGEQQSAKVEAANSQVGLEIENIGLNYRNNDAVATSIARIQSAVTARASIEGWTEERLELELWENTSRGRAAQVAQLMSTGQPQDVMHAKALFESGKENGSFTLQNMNTLESTLQSAAPKAEATIAYNRFRSGSGQSIATMSVDDVFDGLLKQESGGKQFKPDGSIVTSSAGAIGIAQVMPATAPEAARDAGVPFDEVKYKTDAAYNAKLGKAYLNKLHKRYKGNTVLALMAYNGGMGNVDKHIKRRGVPQTPQQIASFIASYPVKETREYVPSIMKRLGVSGGDVNDVGDVGNIEANAPQSPEARELYNKMIATDRKNQEALKKEQAKIVEDALFEKLYENNGDTSQLSVPEIEAAKRHGVWEKVAKYKGNTDSDYSNDVISMTPQELSTHELDRSRLSANDYKKFHKLQQDSLKPEGKVMQQQIDNVAKYYFRTIAGKDVDNKDLKPTVAKFKEALTNQVEALKVQSGKLPSTEQISVMGKQIMEASFDEGFFFDSFHTDRGFMLDVESISKEDREGIEQSILDAGMQVSEAEVIRRYPEWVKFNKQGASDE